MDAAESKLPSSSTDGSIEVKLVQGTVRFGSNSARRNLVESDAAKTIEGGIRALVRGNRNDVVEPVSEPYSDVTVAGTKAIADIERLMGELLVARDYLEAEGERVRQVSARYAIWRRPHRHQPKLSLIVLANGTTPNQRWRCA